MFSFLGIRDSDPLVADIKIVSWYIVIIDIGSMSLDALSWCKLSIGMLQAVYLLCLNLHVFSIVYVYIFIIIFKSTFLFIMFLFELSWSWKYVVLGKVVFIWLESKWLLLLHECGLMISQSLVLHPVYVSYNTVLVEPEFLPCLLASRDVHGGGRWGK